jgi:hypothetical protein
MGLVATVLSMVRRALPGRAPTADIKVDPWGNAPTTSTLYQPAGDDALPLAADASFIGDSQKNGAPIAVAFLDVVNAGVTNPGEKRIYARDSGGAIVSSIHLKNDGTIAITSNGTVNINGAKIDSSGKVETSAGVDLDQLQADFDAHVAVFNDHFHVAPAGGGNTGTPQAGPPPP